MAKHRAYVYKETAGIDEYRVYPPVVVLQHGDKFELVNVADGDATFEVPAGVFGGAVNESIKPGKGSGDKTAVSGNDAIAAEYRVEVKGKKAKANSDPVIIIDL